MILVSLQFKHWLYKDKVEEHREWSITHMFVFWLKIGMQLYTCGTVHYYVTLFLCTQILLEQLSFNNIL